MTVWLPVIMTGVIYGVAVPQYDVPFGHYYTYTSYRRTEDRRQ